MIVYWYKILEQVIGLYIPKLLNWIKLFLIFQSLNLVHMEPEGQ